MMSNVVMTPGQEFELFFDLDVAASLQGQLEIKVEPLAGLDVHELRRTFAKSHRTSSSKRTANFLGKVSNGILCGMKKKIFPSLGKYTVFADGAQVLFEDLSPVCIVDNSTYFETTTVPDELSHMGFMVHHIGGKGNPDLVAYHTRINPQKVDVEPTLTKMFKLDDLDSDKGKYERYINKYNFKRLLIVCHADKVSTEVIQELNGMKDPVGFVEYKDLYSLRTRTRSLRDQEQAYTMLTMTGKIVVAGSCSPPFLFQPIRFFIQRKL